MGKFYDKAYKVMRREFGKIRKLYIATSVGNFPEVQIVTTCFVEKAFYVFIDKESKFTSQISENKKVCLCTLSSFHKFNGEAIELGHPLDDDNSLLRDKLIEVTKSEYLNKIDESNENLQLVRIDLSKGYTYNKKFNYQIDFEKNEAIENTFSS
jgi:hypothetical protein